MAKSAILFVLTLFVLQGSYANEFQTNKVGELVVDLQNVIKEVSTRSFQFFFELGEKFTEIEKSANFPALVSEVKQNVQQILVQDTSNVCEVEAYKKVRYIEKLASVLSCNLQVNENVSNLKQQIQVLGQKLQNLMQEVSTVVFKCMKENIFNLSGMKKCVEGKVDEVKQQLEKVKESIDETFNELESLVPVFTDKMSVCVDEQKQKVEEQMKVVVQEVQDCVISSQKVTRNVNVGQAAELIEELKQILKDVSVRSIKFFKELEQKFVEINNAADFPSLLSEAKQNIQQILVQDSSKSCEVKAAWKLKHLERISSVMSCKFQVNDDASDLNKKFQELISKVKELLVDVNKVVYKCMTVNFFEFDKFVKCVEEQIVDIKEQVDIVKNSIEETFNILDSNVPIYTQKMTECVEERKQYFVAQKKIVVEDIQKCVQSQN